MLRTRRDRAKGNTDGSDLSDSDEVEPTGDTGSSSADRAEETALATGSDEEESPPAFEPPRFAEAVKQAVRPFSRLLAPRSTAGGGRLSGLSGSTGARGTRPRAQPATGTEEERRAVTYIDKRERIIGFFFGAVQIALGIIDYIAYRHYVDKSSHAKTLSVHHAAPWVLGIGLVFGVFTILATLSKRRAALGFVILLGGLDLLQSGGGLFGIVYFGVGIWMIFRALKRNPRGGSARQGRAPVRGARTSATASTTTASSRSTTRAGTTPTRRPASAAAGKRPAPAATTPRYTPPKPRRPVPAKQDAEPESSNRVLNWLRR